MIVLGDGVEHTTMRPSQTLRGTVTIDDADDGSSRDGEPDLLVMWTDGSRTDEGRVGAAVAYRREEGWKTLKRHLGTNKEVYDAELYGLGMALKEAKKLARAGGFTEVEIRCDAQAALQRIKDNRPGPGQWLAQRVLDLEEELHTEGVRANFRWVRGHKGIEGNEKADEAAKQATSPKVTRLPQEESFASLAHINRTTTDRKWAEHRQWLEAHCKGHTAYTLTSAQRTDRAPATAEKRTAARYYQLKTGHALIGTYLKRIGRNETDECWWCRGKTRQTRTHLLKDCRTWRRQQHELWEGMAEERDKDGKPDGLNKTASVENLFAHPKAAVHILRFLRVTQVGRRTTRGREQRRPAKESEDEWGWEDAAEGENEVAVAEGGSRSGEG